MKAKAALLILLLGSTELWAAVSPISLNIVPPVQFPPNDFSVAGLRVSALWGKHRKMYGLDVGGVGNITEQDFGGLAVAGIFNATQGNTTIVGGQFAGITNMNTNKTTVIGLQVAGAVNYNKADSSLVGIQLAALANLNDHTNIYGFQVGLYNTVQDMYGIQVGLINKAVNLHGLQIGLVNFHEKGFFKVCPFLNVGF